MPAKKCKTPAALARVLMERHPAIIEHTEEKLRVKRTIPVESQGEHIRAQSEGEMAAFAEGYAAALADVQHEFNCYAGFQHYGPAVRTIVSKPEEVPGTVRHSVSQDDGNYLSWRRLYYTNGIAKK